MTDVWNLDGDFFEEVIQIGGEHYLLREASGKAANIFQNEAAKKSVFKDGQVVSVRNPADTAPMLISLCLVECDSEGLPKTTDKGKEIPVTVAKIESWPNKIQKALFKKILEVSDLDPSKEDDEEEEKKR